MEKKCEITKVKTREIKIYNVRKLFFDCIRKSQVSHPACQIAANKKGITPTQINGIPSHCIGDAQTLLNTIS